MKVRYHVIPKDKTGDNKKYYLESDNTKVKVHNVKATDTEYQKLRKQLEDWYTSHNIEFIPVSSETDGLCYTGTTHLTPSVEPMTAPYYYAGGCGAGEFIEEMEAQQRELMDATYQDPAALDSLIDSSFLDDGYGYIEETAYVNSTDWEDTYSPGITLDEPSEGINRTTLSYGANAGMYDPPVSVNVVTTNGNATNNSNDIDSKKVEATASTVSNHTNMTSVTSFGGKRSNNGFKGRGKYNASLRAKKNYATEEGMVLGRHFDGEPIAINDIGSGGQGLIFEGILNCIEVVETRNGKAKISGNIVDKTNSLSFIRFEDDIETGEQIKKALKDVKHCIVRGDVNYDERFARDYVLSLYDVKAVDKTVQREEHREDSRVELHLHTKMSDKDALVDVKELLGTIKDWGHPAVAITDHGVVQAFPLAQAIAKEKGVKVIYGVEAYLIDDEEDKKRYHIILLAENMVGIRNLYKMVSMSHLQYYKRRPRLPRTVIEEHREGIIIGSACEAGELMQAIVRNESQETLLEIASFYDYLEIQPICNNMFLVRSEKPEFSHITSEDFLIQMNKTVVELGENLNKPVVATCDVHYLNPEDKIYREIMLTASGFPDAQFQPDLHLRTTDEMLAEFQHLGAEKAYEVVVTNSRMINDRIENLSPVPDGTYSPKIEGAEKALSDMCYENAKAIYGDPLPTVVQERLEYELGKIIGHGFAVLYYIAHKLVKNSLDKGYLVGSRGSVGSSFVATMAEITEVNPLPPHYVCPECKYSEFYTEGEYFCGFDMPRKKCPKCGANLHTNGHEIPFAIFMGFDGDKVPDIDLNFSGDYQAKAHKYTEELFGRDNVFKAGTIGTIAEKTAKGYVRKYAEIRGFQARDGFLTHLAQGFTGVKNTTGQHPGGIMVCPRDMDVHQFTPVQHPANKKESGVTTTHFDYHSIEGRMTKLDILGHDDPTIIRMLEDMTGIDIQSIPFDDPQTLSLFNSTDALGLTPEQLMGDKVATLAVPECGTSFVRKMLEDSKPSVFSDLVRISGFSHGTNVWLDNAQTLITTGVCKLNEAISTRDDILNYLRLRKIDPMVAFSVMENVRKGKGIEKRNKQGEATTNFEQVMRDGGIPEWFLESCKKISYLFPKAHAVAYVMMAFRIAWFKINYPLAFYAAYFSIRAKAYDVALMKSPLEAQISEYKRLVALKNDRKASPVEENMITALEVSMEMVQRGYHFGNVSIKYSQARRFCIIDDVLIPPFLMVDSLGEKVADMIIEERNKKMFTSVKDLQRRAKVSQSIIGTMRDLGCFEELPEDEQMDLFAM